MRVRQRGWLFSSSSPAGVLACLFVASITALCNDSMTWSASMTLGCTDEFVDPQLEAFCAENPDALECLVYDD
eukprot:959279-Prorocentrum_minimum.AAC.3